MKFNLLTETDVRNKRVFIRSDLNVPIDEVSGTITDDTRIKASLKAVNYALEQGAAVMVTSHLGRPKEGEFDERFSLAVVAERMRQLLDRPVRLQRDWVGGVSCLPGEVVLLENCRFNVGEGKNNEALGKQMAQLCDVYVNDAFGTAHRAHATTHQIALHAGQVCAGPLMAAELHALSRALAEPKRPLVAIVAGSKVSTKLTILKSLAARVDQLIVGGGIANTFMQAKGMTIGKSLSESGLVDEALAIIDMMAARNASVPIPVDVVVSDRFAADAEARIVQADQVTEDDMIFDIGPASQATLAQIIAQAGTIVWNGPVGVFEFDQFGAGSQALAQAIAQAKGFSIAGGGDTLAAISKYQVSAQIDYISTGGGAFLEFLEGKTLPAVEVLQNRVV